MVNNDGLKILHSRQGLHSYILSNFLGKSLEIERTYSESRHPKFTVSKVCFKSKDPEGSHSDLFFILLLQMSARHCLPSYVKIPTRIFRLNSP